MMLQGAYEPWLPLPQTEEQGRGQRQLKDSSMAWSPVQQAGGKLGFLLLQFLD